MWWIKPAVGLLAVAAVAWALHAGYQSIWQRGYDAKTFEVELQRAKDERTAAIAALAREAEVRAVEVAQAARMDAVEAEWAKRMRDAETNADTVAADLRAGNVRLRQHWDSCRATSALSGAAAPESGPDGSDRLRVESLRRVLGWVGKLQAQRDALIDACEVGR